MAEADKKAGQIRVGEVEISGRAFLAPMAGISDAPFRTIAERYGAALVVSEMIASASLTSGMAEMQRKLRPSGRLPHVVQLAGNEEKWLVLGARMAADAGADIIDINLGCPSKKVTNGYAGSALMRVPDKALALIEAVIGAVDLPVTVKMRLGWNDQQINAPLIARLAEGAGVRMLVVHGRTRQQFYKGRARWEPVRDVVEAVSIPVVVNGDVVDTASARKALAASGAAAVMIGRGAQGQPWIVGQVNRGLTGRGVFCSPDKEELVDVIIGHYREILTTYGRELGVRVARKHLRWYLQRAGIGEPDIRQSSLLTLDDAERVIATVGEMLDFHFQSREVA